MFWRKKPPPVPLTDAQRLDLNNLSPKLAGMLKALISKLEASELEESERTELQLLYEALPERHYYILAKGKFNDYGGPVERIRVIPANPKRK